MASENKSWGKLFGIGLGVVALGAGAVWAAKHWADLRATDDLHTRLAQGDVDEMRAAMLTLDREKLKTEEGKKTLGVAADRMKEMSFEEMMAVMRSGDLSDEERRRLRRLGWEMMRTRMNEHVDEYFDAPKDQREKILDRHIDEFQEFREQMRAWREKHRDDPDAQRDRGERRGRWQRDRQSSKERMEGGNPDQQKRMMYYWGQMRARAKARGIEMWGGRGGHRPGGGRGGSGSGGSRPGGRGG